MKKKLTSITIIIFFLLMLSCTYKNNVPFVIKQNFEFLYDGKNDGIDSLININGFYTISEPLNNYYLNAEDTFYMNYLFFKDGMFLGNFGFYDCDSPICISEKLKEIANDTIGYKRKSFSISYLWGRYRVSGDTIITHYIHKCSSINDQWSAWESKFKIINKKTIIEINSKPIHYMTESDRERWKISHQKQEYKPAIFVPAETIPNSDSWLKNETWFWKHDSLRKLYKNN